MRTSPSWGAGDAVARGRPRSADFQLPLVTAGIDQRARASRDGFRENLMAAIVIGDSVVADVALREMADGALLDRLVALTGVDLSSAQIAEVDELAARYGTPRRGEVAIRPFFDPVQRPDRFAEVCMVIRRRNGKVPLSIKTFYPRGAYRLPTGGIHHGERILDALLRETYEETGLQTEVRRFLAWITYRDVSTPHGPPLFHTFAFLQDEVGGTFKTSDEEEQIEDWVEIEPSGLREAAERLDTIASAWSDDVGGDWADWGHFRAVVHRVVHEELAG